MKRKNIFTKGAVFTLCMCLTGNLTASASYNGQKAADYATKYAKTPNSSYHTFKYDCTNFASQCINAGGIKMKNAPESVLFDRKTPKDEVNWYHVTGCGGLFYRATTSWTVVADLWGMANLHNLKTSVFSQRLSAEELAKNVKVGDVVQISKKGNLPTHSIICVKVNGKTIDQVFFASHTSNYKKDSIKEIRRRYAKDNNDMNVNNVAFCIIRPK